MREQHGFTYQQTRQGRQVIQRKSIAPPGQGTYYQEPPANPHRSGHSSGIHPEDMPFMTGDPRYPQAQTRTPIPEEYDDEYPSRMPTSTRRYPVGADGQPTQVYRQGNRTFVRHKGAPPPQPSLPPQQYPIYADESDEQETEHTRPKRGYTRKMHFHPLVYLGAGMIVMFGLWVMLSILSAWGKTQLDDWHYGRPRTFQIDAVVGHGDSPGNPSHFTAINLNRHVVVIELPGGDTGKARIYNVTTLFGDGQDLTPVTLTFTDVKGDGKPDMVIHIQDQRIIFHNDGTQFKPQ